MQNTLKILLLTIFCLGALTACTNETKTAMIDVNAIIGKGPHAQEAAKYLQEAQKIYQHNLYVIEGKLAKYENKEQARAYLIEATRQLQEQLNNSKILATQALLDALNPVLAEQKKIYDLIIKKDGIIYVKEGDGQASDKFEAMPEDITSKVEALYANTTVTYPPLPKIVNNPELPADDITKKEDEATKAESNKETSNNKKDKK